MTISIKVEITEKYLKKILKGKKLSEYRHIGKNSLIIFHTRKRIISMGIEDISILPKYKIKKLIKQHKDIPFNLNQKLFEIKLKGTPKKLY